MTTRRSTTLASSILLGLASCTNTARQPESTSVAPEPTPDTLVALTSNQIKPDDTNSEARVYDYTIFPIDSTYSIKVLTTGSFHSNEVWENADTLDWFGLFRKGQRHYVTKTEISTVRVEDQVSDEEGQKTGWQVVAMQPDTCVFLVEALSYLQDREVESVPVTGDYIYPEDTVSFSYLGTGYQLYATGEKKKVQEHPVWYEVWNYRLFLTATIHGKKLTTLLAAAPNFDDKMIDVIFAGDIDGDGIVDLIIDTAMKYNGTRPTLYLSREAKAGEIVKPVGVHRTVGC